jgi:hypothetical protein
MTTHESSRAVRWFVIIVLGIATGAMIAVSLRANFLFGYGFGQTPEKAYVFGFANVGEEGGFSDCIVRFFSSLMPGWLCPRRT